MKFTNTEALLITATAICIVALMAAFAGTLDALILSNGI